MQVVPKVKTEENKKVEQPVTPPKVHENKEIASTDEVMEDGRIYHRIQKGETLYSLAKRYGITVEKLCEINNFTSNTIIRVDQRIRCS